jgi:hypothetical protein
MNPLSIFRQIFSLQDDSKITLTGDYIVIRDALFRGVTYQRVDLDPFTGTALFFINNIVVLKLCIKIELLPVKNSPISPQDFEDLDKA